MATTDRVSSYDVLLKVLLIGDSGVGKSSILLRFASDRFDDEQLATIGVDFKVKFVDLEGKRIKLFVWDTAGQERFRTLTSSYYRGAQGIILVYDTTARSSFESLSFWLQEVQKHSTNADAIKLLIANKVDKVQARWDVFLPGLMAHEPAMGASDAVSRSEGERFAMEHSMLFIETSARTRFGIQQAFEELLLRILESPTLLQASRGSFRQMQSAYDEVEGGAPSSSRCC